MTPDEPRDEAAEGPDRRVDPAPGEDRGLFEQLVDYGIYAPLGAAIRAAEHLPGLVDKGRRQATGRIATARLIGRFAVDQARRRLGDTLADFAHGGAAEPGASGGAGEHGAPESMPGGAGEPEAGRSGAGPPASPCATAGPVAEAPAARPSAPSHRAPPAAAAGAPEEATAGSGPATRPEEIPAIERLAIPNYGSLAASQVVPRLPGLSAQELELVRRYEMANRGRRTVLNRIAQLQSGAPGGDT